MVLIKVERSDAEGCYYMPVSEIATVIDGELINEGDSVTLTLCEMQQENYEALPEFVGW